MKRYTIYLPNGTEITIRAANYLYSEDSVSFQDEEGKNIAIFNRVAIAGWVTYP